MIRLFSAFVKLTGLPAALLVFRTKVYYENKAAQGRRIKGAAVLVSNHTSVFDYAVYLFVFFTRTLRTLMAEVLFEKKLLALFLKLMGGVRIDRGAAEYGYMGKCEAILRKGGVLCVFPEGRLPLKDETPPLPFRPGAAYLSLCTGTPVIPVYTDGAYFGKARARVIIGEPVIPPENVSCADPAAVEEYNRVLRQKIISLGELLEKRRKEEKA
jgi:1-acyl-sn-glycerol-3-phosphate acyltransferase